MLLSTAVPAGQLVNVTVGLELSTLVLLLTPKLLGFPGQVRLVGHSISIQFKLMG